MTKTLEGIRVADFSRVMAGPFASHFLTLLGAEVIKVETREGGDPMRDYGDDRRYDGMAPAFIAVNAGKKSVALDLKQPAGREVARRLIATSDVVLENFRPGVMDKLGLGYDACKALRPDIVFCAVTGYGQTGPLKDYPAIDNIVQATSGMMSLGGDATNPARVGFPVVDSYAGTLAAFAIVAALLGRERTGAGQYIDVAMLDASLVLMAPAVVPSLVTARPPPRTGNAGFSGLVTAGMFVAKDGSSISLGAVQQNQYEALCRAIERPDLIEDSRFATTEARRQNAGMLRDVLAEVFATRDGAEWERRLSEAGAPCGLVRDVPTVLAHPQLGTRDVLQPIQIDGLPEREDVYVLNAGFQFAEDGPGVATRPPRLGEHTDEVLAKLGFAEHERAALRASGAAYSEKG